MSEFPGGPSNEARLLISVGMLKLSMEIAHEQGWPPAAEIRGATDAETLLNLAAWLKTDTGQSWVRSNSCFARLAALEASLEGSE